MLEIRGGGVAAGVIVAGGATEAAVDARADDVGDALALLVAAGF